jgi:superoxide dismutase, Cu-Zn family
MMRPLRLMLAMLVVGLPAVVHAQSARATLRDAQGTVVGAATLNEVRGGVKIAVQVSGLKPGEHGFHIHAVGMCEPPAFTTAGAHFNPYGKEHGHKNPKGAHAGDLPNLTVRADGTGSIDVTAAGVTLTPGGASLLQPGGTSLVIHADPDDEKTDPAGNSGTRIVCGVIASTARK